MPTPPTLAAIDAGSNAIRVMVALPTGPGELEVIAAERAPVRLGRGTFVRGALDARTIDAAFTAFSRFRRLFDEHHVSHYRAVATSALRNASNREDLIDRLWRELGLELEVIDGEEEARLVRKAVLHRLRGLRGRRAPEVIADLGGGSLEVLCRTGDDWVTSSMRIGTVRMLDTFGIKGALSVDEARVIGRFVASTLRGALPEDLYTRRRSTLVACGGNAEALVDLFGQRDKQGVSVLPLASLEEHLPDVCAADLRTRMADYGVRRDRAEVMGVAALVFATLGRELGIDRFVVPRVGIRDGVLLDLAETSVGELSAGREAPALAAARTFAARMGHNTAHGEHVRRIAAQLFEQLAPVHQIPAEHGLALQLAALLHDVGEVVHRKSHHKHSEYLIRQGRIPGLESPIREMAAAIARAHRKSMPSHKKHASYGGLDAAQQDDVRKMAALLRIADALDTDHRQRVVAVSTEIRSKKVLFNVSVERGAGKSIDADTRKSHAFEAELGRRPVFSFTEVTTDSARRPGRRSE